MNVAEEVRTAPAAGRRRAALGEPHVTRVLVTSLLARMPSAMGTLVLLLLIAPRHGYALAGLACTAYVAASAVTSPLLARAVDRFGARRVVLPTGAGNALGFLALAVLPRSELPAQYAAAVVAGLALPPISATARGLWPRLLPETMLPVLYGLEATLQEIIYITGPALVAGVSGIAGARAAAAVTAAIGLCGATLFATTPVFGRPPAAGSTDRLGFRDAAVLLPWLLLGSSLVMAFSMDEVAVVAFVSPGRAGGTVASGIVLAVWSAGSMVGGVVFGARQRVATNRTTLTGCAAIGLGLAVVAVAPNRVALGALLFGTGCLIAPGLSQIYQRVAASAPSGGQTETFGWLALAFIIGAAAGAAVGGGLVSALGARAGLALAALPPLAGAALALLALWRRTDRPPIPQRPVASAS